MEKKSEPDGPYINLPPGRGAYYGKLFDNYAKSGNGHWSYELDTEEKALGVLGHVHEITKEPVGSDVKLILIRQLMFSVKLVVLDPARSPGQ